MLKRDLPFLNAISGARLRREIGLIFAEEATDTVLRRCEALGVLQAIHAALSLDGAAVSAFARARDERLTPLTETYFCLLTAGATGEMVDSLIERLSLTARTAEALRDSLRLRPLVSKLGKRALAPSEVALLLGPLCPPAVAAFALGAPRSLARRRAERYLREWRYVRPSLRGDDLLELGIPRGPEVGALLERLRAYRVDGRVRSRREEVAVVLARRAELSRQPAPAGGSRRTSG
jgi:tRNA nucleotidyltransferase (CCA-adding enzyme)